jgi:hypothetical protein
MIAEMVFSIIIVYSSDSDKSGGKILISDKPGLALRSFG